MKHIVTLSFLSIAPLLAHAGDACCPDHGKFDAPKSAVSSHAHGPGENNPRVILTENQRANLSLKTEVIGPAKIASTVFALGELSVYPSGESAAASRIPGRVVALSVALGDRVKRGDTLALVESRQPGGDPARVAITAPADGTVTEVLTRLGEPVSPDAPLLRLADLSRLVAEARVPQRFADALRPGSTLARITPEGGETRTLALRAITPVADPVSGTVRARFEWDNAEGRFTPGRRCEFRLILSETEHALTVPRGAVQGDRGEFFVFIENAAGVYEKHPVVVGEGDDLRVAVTGPEAGERVVSHGAYSLCYADSAGISLKEALDAAHGHSHGPNGEEPGATSSHTHAGHDHAGHSHEADASEDLMEDPDAMLAQSVGIGVSTHTHADGTVHDADHRPVDAAASAPRAKSALQAELDAAHGHAHGPNGEELGDSNHAAPVATGGWRAWFTGDSAAVFYATLAFGEAILLALALAALRRKARKEGSDA